MVTHYKTLLKGCSKTHVSKSNIKRTYHKDYTKGITKHLTYFTIHYLNKLLWLKGWTLNTLACLGICQDKTCLLNI